MLNWECVVVQGDPDPLSPRIDQTTRIEFRPSPDYPGFVGCASMAGATNDKTSTGCTVDVPLVGGSFQYRVTTGIADGEWRVRLIGYWVF